MRNRMLSYPVLFLLFMPFITHCRQDPPPIKIGFVANLTGNANTLAIGARNGVLMAVDDINAKGGINGRKIELIVKDDQSDTEIAVRMDQELIRENVVAIIGHIHSTMSYAALPVINQAKIVMLSPVSASSQLSGLDDYFFRINPSTTNSSIKPAKYAYDKGLRRLSGIYDIANKSYSKSKYLDFKNAFEALGGHMVSVQTFSSLADESFQEPAKNMTRDHPDGYFIVAGPRDSAMICQHLRKIDRTRPILTSGWALDPEFLQNGGAAVEGVILSHSFHKDSRDPEFLKFKENFYHRYKTIPGIWETYAYEAVMVLSQALSMNPDPALLKTTLLKTKRFDGLQGDIAFDRYGDNHRETLLFQIKNGASIEIR